MQEAVTATDGTVKCDDHEMPMLDFLEAIKYNPSHQIGFEPPRWRRRSELSTNNPRCYTI
jgi:hypothetical protein